MQLAQRQGYLTYDDILSASDLYDLSTSDVDALSEAISLLGVILYEHVPSSSQTRSQQIIDSSFTDTDDLARVDYAEIFSRIIEESPSMEPFVHAVAQITPPQARETSRLVKQLLEGNNYARTRLIEMHLRLALKTALNCTQKYDLDLEDAIADSIDGLIIAVDKYDPNGFSAFTSYASLWMQQRIMRFSNPKWMEFYSPFHAKQIPLQAKQIYDDHFCPQCQNGSCPQVLEEISTQLSISISEAKEAVEVIERNLRTTSLDQLSDDEKESMCFATKPDMFDIILLNDLEEQINKSLSSLKDKERDIIKMRFGLVGPEMTLEEVGQQFDVTRERIRQIEVKALKRLRHPSRSKRLKDYY